MKATGRCTLALLVFIFLTPLAFGEEEVGSAAERLILSGILQAGFSYHIGNQILLDPEQTDGEDGGRVAAARGDLAEFYLSRARFSLAGRHLGGNLGFLARWDLVPEPEIVDLWAEMSYIPYTVLRLGRFAPELSFFGPREVSDLFLIDPPLMDANPWGESLLGFRRTGLSAHVRAPFLEAQFGILNGGTDGGFGDENTAKDFFLNVTYKYYDVLKVKGAYYYGLALNEGESEIDPDGNFRELNDASQTFVAGVWFHRDLGILLVAEAAYRILTTAEEASEDIKSLSCYGMAGFNLRMLTRVPLEFVVRYDYFDPDLDNDAGGTGQNDELTAITGGVNLEILRRRAMVYLNYIHRIEAWKDVQAPDGGTQTGIEDDEIKLQVQVSF